MYTGFYEVREGDTVEMEFTDGYPVASFSRVLDNGSEFQKYTVDGTDGGFWVGNNGKIDSSNYSVKLPGTLIIRNVSENDVGSYEYVSTQLPPEGVESMPPAPIFLKIVKDE